MKIYRYKILGLVLAGMFAVSSCNNDDLLELNINPNAANEIDPTYILANAQLQVSGTRYESWRGMLIYSATMMQHMAALPGYWSGDKYLYNPQYSGALYERAYPGFVKSLAAILEQTKDQPELANVNAVANIMWVFGMSRLTDMYGDIPYFEAGRGFYDNVYFPKFDPQSEIYPDMLQRLETAAANLNPSLEGSFGTTGAQDLVFGGDIDKWEKFANSLMLRLAMRLTEVDESLAQQYVQKAISGGLMESNDDIAYVEHTDGPGGINRNGIGEVFVADNNQRLSKTFIDFMENTNDPRLEIIATPNEDGVVVGLPNGYDATTIKEYEGTEDAVTADMYSTTNPLMVSFSSPMFFQTYAEVQFLLAEAALRGWTNSDPTALYENGVRSAMEFLSIYDVSMTIESDAIDAYLAENPFVVAEGFEMIGEQYWMVTFLNEYESWANWRRTGYPLLTPVDYPGNISDGQIPRRLRYFENEYGNNGEELQAALSRMGPDEFTTRMWWDVE